MRYIIFTEDQYGHTWSRKDCDGTEAAKDAITLGLRAGEKPLLTVEVPYTHTLTIGQPGGEPLLPPPGGKPEEDDKKEEAKVEAKKSPTKPGHGTD